MIETFDIRLPEEWAVLHLDSTWGRALPLPFGFPPMTRQVTLRSTDPRMKVLAESIIRFPPMSMTADCRRKYDDCELAEAQLLQLVVTGVIEQCGVDYGTVYDDREACLNCGVGRKQCSALHLDLTRISRKIDVAFTQSRGNELVVSDRLARIIREKGIKGCKLTRIEHVGAQRDVAPWYQLVVVAEVGHAIAPTRFGKDCLRADESNEFVCSEHGLSGLNLVSEVSVEGPGLDQFDVFRLKNRYGTVSGHLQPSPILVMNQTLFHLLTGHDVAGFEAEVVRIVS